MLGGTLKDSGERLPQLRIHGGIPVAQHVDHLVLGRIQDVVTHQSVLPGSESRTQAGEGSCRG